MFWYELNTWYCESKVLCDVTIWMC